EAEDASAAIGAAVGQDLDELVRSEGGDVAHGAVLEGQDIAFGAEGVVARAHGRAAVDTGRRARDAGLQGGRTETPDVEVAPALLEGRGGEEDLRQPPRVLLELVPLRRRIAVPED